MTCYAQVSLFKDWILEADPSSKCARPLSVRIANPPAVLLTLSLSASAVFTLALAAMARAIIKHPRMGDSSTFFTGACSTATNLDIAGRVILNVFSWLFLGAGNYTMQILVVPSLQETNAVHNRG